MGVLRVFRSRSEADPSIESREEGEEELNDGSRAQEEDEAIQLMVGARQTACVGVGRWRLAAG